jgi:predicted transcriptional regulator of viral defense system
MNNVNFVQPESGAPIKASDSVKWLLSRGISSATTNEFSALLGIPPNQVPQRLAALKRRGEIVSPARGLWAPVAPEYLSWGAPPAIDIIDALMRHLNTAYYIGWLSAAELLGASHHAPQVFQVAASKAIRPRTVGRSQFRFYHREHIGCVSLMYFDAKSGMVPVSSRETTLLDIAGDIGIAGGIDNAANLIIELCEAAAPDIDELVALSIHYPAVALRRLGFLMERYTEISTLDKLKTTCAERNAAVSLLDPQAENSGIVNAQWKIKINREVSPDV